MLLPSLATKSSKMKELIVDYRKRRTNQAHINRAVEERGES